MTTALAEPEDPVFSTPRFADTPLLTEPYPEPPTLCPTTSLPPTHDS